MATTKTAMKTATSPKKALPKSNSKNARVATSSSSTKMKTRKSVTVSDLQKKVLDPKNRRSLYLAIGVIVLAAAVFLGKGLLVAALVNGEPVSRIAIIHDLEAQSGKAALDAVITRKLVFQEATKKNVIATEKDIDAEIAKIKKQFQSQGQNLDQLLLTQGLTKEKFREKLCYQIIIIIKKTTHFLKNLT